MSDLEVLRLVYAVCAGVSGIASLCAARAIVRSSDELYQALADLEHELGEIDLDAERDTFERQCAALGRALERRRR